MDCRSDIHSGDFPLPRLLPLLFFNSAFAVAYAGFLLREVSVRSYASEAVSLVPVFLFLVLAACGGLAGHYFRNVVNSPFPAILAPFPVLSASVLLPVLLPQLSMTRQHLSSAMLILPALALPLFFTGLNFCFALHAVCFRRAVLLSAIHNAGAAFSGILLGCLIYSFDDMLILLLLSGLFLLVLSLCFHLPRLKRGRERVFPLLWTCGCAAWLIYVSSGFLERRLFLEDPLRGGGDAVRLDTAYGRSELLRMPDKRFLFLSNGQSVATLPGNPERDRLAALMSGVQADRKRIRVLLICSAFSGLPEAFASLPLTASLDLVVRDREVAKLAEDIGILPPESSVFRVVIDDPARFVDSTFHVYDVIFVDPPLPQNLDADRLFSHEFYCDAAGRLSEGGVFVTTLPAPFGYTRESIAELHGIIAATMRSVFPNVVFVPGAAQLAVGGGRNIISDLDTLDARAAALMGENDAFPEGLLVILHSQAEQLAQAQKIIGRSIVSASNRRSDAPLLLNYWRRHPVFTEVVPAACLLRMADFLLFYRWELIGGILLAYLCIRYFGSVTIARKNQFLSLENGFFLGGLFMFSMLLFQSMHGTLYRMLGLAAGLFWIGSAAGIFLAARFRISGIWVKILSFFLPVLPILFLAGEGGMPFPLTGGILFCAGMSGGVVLHALTGGENGEGAVSCWIAETGGAALGIVLVSFFMIAQNGFFWCAALLMLSRAPCLFRPFACLGPDWKRGKS